MKKAITYKKGAKAKRLLDPDQPYEGIFPLVDLFAGAGGMTLGFTKLSRSPFVPVWANDFNKFSVETYNRNFGQHCKFGDLVDILEKERRSIPRAAVVIGGPPCQGFSLLNRHRDGDPRKQLWRPYFEVVEISKAEIFVMENVPQLLGSDEYAEIIEKATQLGFKTWAGKLCAADYGVPQVRWRAFIVGCKFADPASFFPPEKTHFNPRASKRQQELMFSNNGYVKNPDEWKTVRDAIEDLPPPIGTEITANNSPLNLHFGRTPTPLSLKRYHVLNREGMNRFDLQRLAPELTPGCWIRKISGGTDLMGRLWWDRPSFTIRTEFFKPEKGRYLHPKQHRPITHREAARLQTFPDDFIFEGTKIEVAKQIGNAVPPLLASHVARCVAKMIKSRK